MCITQDIIYSNRISTKVIIKSVLFNANNEIQ